MQLVHQFDRRDLHRNSEFLMSVTMIHWWAYSLNVRMWKNTISCKKYAKDVKVTCRSQPKCRMVGFPVKTDQTHPLSFSCKKKTNSMLLCLLSTSYNQNLSSLCIFGCFRKWWYPQIIHFNMVFHYKPSILGYPYFWKPPYICWPFPYYSTLWHSPMTPWHLPSPRQGWWPAEAARLRSLWRRSQWVSKTAVVVIPSFLSGKWLEKGVVQKKSDLQLQLLEVVHFFSFISFPFI